MAEARGVALKRHGADLIGLCPFHDDKNPSLVVSPAKNLWHCLGACQAGGSVVDWVMKAEGVSFRHAMELLRSDLPLAGRVKAVKTSSVRKLPPPVSAEADERREHDRNHAAFYTDAPPPTLLPIRPSAVGSQTYDSFHEPAGRRSKSCTQIY